MIKFNTMNLTSNQIDFLVNNFFKSDYAGARNIAIKLVTLGKWTVAGTKCTWKGGIGNFIETKTSEDFIGCCEYHFNLEEFKNSELFKERWKKAVINTKSEINNLNKKIESLDGLRKISKDNWV